MSSEPNPAPSKIIPNTFQTPNLLAADDGSLMSYLTGNEVKCYLVIVRKIFGWNKKTDRISKSQIMSITGLGEATVESCMESLVHFGLVLRVAENNPNKNYGVEWELQLQDTQIRWDALADRLANKAVKSKKQTEIARSVRSSVGGDVQQPQHVQHAPGGDVGYTKQKPLSITNNKEEESAPQKSKIFQVYEQEFGALTPLIADAIKDAEKDFPEQWILEAMTIAVERNARNWKYVRAVLDDAKAKKMSPKLNNQSKQKGKSNDNYRPGNKPNPKPKPASAGVSAEINRRRREKSVS